MPWVLFLVSVSYALFAQRFTQKWKIGCHHFLLLSAIIHMAMFWFKWSTPPIPSLYFLMHSGFYILTQSFFSLMYRFVFAVGFNQYFDDTTITTLSFFHMTKAILVLSSITTSADRLSSFSISFTVTVFNGTFSTLFNQTAPVAAISFSIKERSNEELWWIYQLWYNYLILHVLVNLWWSCQLWYDNLILYVLVNCLLIRQLRILQAPNLDQRNRLYPCKGKIECQQPKVCIQFYRLVFHKLLASMSTKIGNHLFVITYCLLREVVGKTLFIHFIIKDRTFLNLSFGSKEVLSAKWTYFIISSNLFLDIIEGKASLWTSAEYSQNIGGQERSTYPLMRRIAIKALISCNSSL